MTAAFEGGLITLAAVVIITDATRSLFSSHTIDQIDTGIFLTLGAGIINALLGWFLIRSGQRHNSLALIADGKHVLADFWTSAGVVIGLALVMATGISWIDPLVAILVGLHLAWIGLRVVRAAMGGLLDEEDPEALRELIQVMNASRSPGIIHVHHLRAIRSGAFRHIDAHLVVPEHWTVEHAHDVADRFERRVTQALSTDAEIAFHMDPCRRNYCRQCILEDCSIRAEPLAKRAELTLREALRTDEQVLQGIRLDREEGKNRDV